jgi:hypothetical protein
MTEKTAPGSRRPAASGEAYIDIAKYYRFDNASDMNNEVAIWKQTDGIDPRYELAIARQPPSKTGTGRYPESSCRWVLKSFITRQAQS